MGFIGRKLLPYQTKLLIKRSNKKHQRWSTDFRTASKIGILFTVEDREKHDSITHFVKELKEQGKQVTVVSFLGKGKENFDFIYDFFTLDDISVIGKITAESVKKFSRKKFDYLFYLDLKPNKLLDSVLAMSEAKCRVGVYTEGMKNDLLELMIKVDDDCDMDELIQYFLRYTKTLTSHDQ